MSPRTILVSALAMAWIAAVLLAGCTSPGATPVATPTPTPAMTPSPQPGEKTSFGEADNGGTYPVPGGAVIQLRLAENPTTGYRWNLSVTPGLPILNETYVPDDPTGKLVGSGGTHVWFLDAAGEGEQVATGSYERSWEAPQGGAPGFTLTLLVSGGTCGAGVCTLPATPPAMPPRYHVYTDEDNGKTVEEQLGETFGIRLQANPSTGFSWNLSLTEGLRLSGDEYIPSTSPGQRVGVGGVQSYTMVTTAKGNQAARAEYRQPWIPAGTVTYMDLEGGFYGILGDDGKKYDPLNLDVGYQEDGLRVAFEATEVQGVAGIHMWGTPVNLTFIDEIPQYTLNVTVV
jgi:inhibitor of cysteine peptidase